MRFDDGDGGEAERQAALLLCLLFIHSLFRTTGNFFRFRGFRIVCGSYDYLKN